MSFQALLFCPDEKTARVVTQVLQELDFQVESGAEPFAAVKKLTAQRFDAVVVDCQNEQNASLVFKSARNSNLNQSSLMVAIVEGQAGVASAFRIGANLVLTKPIAIEQARSTLRVARGLLRKGEGTAQAAATTAPAPAPAPAAAPATPPVARTSKPVSAPVSPKPSSAPKLPAVAASQPPSFTKAAPAIPVASVPNSVLEVDNGPELKPDEAEAGLLEALDNESTGLFSQHEEVEPAASAVAPAPSKPAGKPFAEFDIPARGLPEMPKPVAPVERPAMAASAVSTSSGAAAAPAREKLTAAQTEKALAIFDPPSTGAITEETIPEDVREQVARLSAPAFEVPQAADEKRGKLPLVAAVVLVVVIAAAYFGWSMLSKKSSSVKPVPQTQSAPITPPVQPQTAPATTPAPEGRFSDSDFGAGTADITLKTSPDKSKSVKPVKPAEEMPEPTAPITSTPINVKSPGRVPKAAQPLAESVQAPALTQGNGETDALSAIVRTPAAVIPKAAPQSVRVSQGVSEGLVLRRVQPVYPQQALRMRQEGSVQLQATISRSGDIQDVKVLNGSPLLSRAAMDAVRQWKYKPYYLNGEPVEIQTQVTVVFKLPR